MLKVSSLCVVALGVSLAAPSVWADGKKSAASKPAARPAAKAKVNTKPKAAAKVTTTAAKKAPAKTVAKKAPAKKKMHPDSKFSYALGNNFGSQIGRSLARGGIVLNVDELLRGVREGLKGKGPSRQVIRQWMMELRRKYRANMMRNRAKMMRNRKSQFSSNIIKGKLFLAKNAKRKGVKVTKSGLQYEIIRKGTGKKPTAASTVETHYKGTLINGTVFDSSYKRGKPARFPVRGVIRGWTEALQLMREGAKWRLYIPYNLAYGARGAGRTIGPYSTLIFDIELIKIVK